MTPGAVVWFCGLPASGKTTLATGLVRLLGERGTPVLWLDSDELRAVMLPAPTFSDNERDLFYATLDYLAVRAATFGVTTVVSATAPRRRYRDQVRAQVTRFVEVWVKCALPELQRRDPKGLYGQAAAGLAPQLPGVGAPFEEPAAAEVVLDSDGRDEAALLAALIAGLEPYLGRELSGAAA